ncbi:hypothetical protein LCGC14_3079730 [marine sediment metagenome]|uniref:Uncharacterized protein n=1 Tax=marine sediment metagenome TaxID=412755 RepID=A0A0F8WDN2_9ZZZZ
MKVRCTNKKCLHGWNYKGSSKNYITCPSCHFRIMLSKALGVPRIKDKQKVGVMSKLKDAAKSLVPKPPRYLEFAGVDMEDGKVPTREELPALRE